ncbi:MAG TPA: hypothetical protein VM122_00770 [Usitatibacter sp.]|nr:hypothetical protein [Usitatibacter sp.]
MALTRRRFLQVGIAGTAVLVAVRLVERSVAPAGAAHRVLDEGTAALVGALAAVVLEGALPAEPALRASALHEVVEAFDRAISGLAPAVRGEIDQLLGTLRLRPARWALTGVWDPLEEASAPAISAFLTRWRESRFDLLRAGYQALTQLINAAWYDNPRAWPAIGYPGPPSLTAR